MSQYFLYKVKGVWSDFKPVSKEIIETDQSPIDYAKSHFYDFLHTEEPTTTYNYGDNYFIGCIVDVKRGTLFKEAKKLVYGIIFVNDESLLSDKLSHMNQLAGELFTELLGRANSYMDRHRSHYDESKPGEIRHSLDLLTEYIKLLK